MMMIKSSGGGGNSSSSPIMHNGAFLGISRDNRAAEPTNLMNTFLFSHTLSPGLDCETAGRATTTHREYGG